MQHTRCSLSSANIFGHLPILMTRHFKCKIALQLLESAHVGIILFVNSLYKYVYIYEILKS
jgi:hypothetical protein